MIQADYVFLRYANRLPSNADSFRTLSLVLEAMGQTEAAVAFARRSLQEIRPDDHEYLSAVQTVWSAYIDRGRFQLAMLVLLEEFVGKRVIESKFEEFRELIELTLDMWHEAQGGKVAAAKYQTKIP